MENERNQEQSKKRIEQMARELAEMVAVASMCRNAPRDREGNVVVNVVGIKNFGLFYQFVN